MGLPLLSFTSWLIHATIGIADEVGTLRTQFSRFAAQASSTTPLRLSFDYHLARGEREPQQLCSDYSLTQASHRCTTRVSTGCGRQFWGNRRYADSRVS